MVRYARHLGWALLGLAASGCTPGEPPGEQVGVFDVVARLKDNTCGQGSIVAMDQRYAIELRQDGDTAYWQILGTHPLAGSFDESGLFTIQAQRPIALFGPGDLQAESASADPLDFIFVDPEQSTNAVGCTLLQTETLTGGTGAAALEDLDAGSSVVGAADDAGAPVPDLVARHRQMLVATGDSDCSPILVENGGAFADLPCEVDYELTGFAR